MINGIDGFLAQMTIFFGRSDDQLRGNKHTVYGHAGCLLREAGGITPGKILQIEVPVCAFSSADVA